MDEYVCLRKRYKAILVHKLGVTHHKPPRPDIIIVDTQQLLYHVDWPCGGSVGVPAESLKNGLHCVLLQKKILVFYRYYEISPKDHARQR